MRCDIAVIVVVSGLLLGACDKEKPADPAATNAAEPTTAAQTNAAPAGEAADGFANFEDSEWCPKAYDDTVKIVAGMKETMKLAGKDAGNDDEFAPPERARYLELCGKLPLEMQKCLVVGYAMKNRDGCQTSLDGLEGDAKAAYGELMGK